MRKICLRCGSKFTSQAEYCTHDGSLLIADTDIADPLLGTVLLEQFRIDEQIGTGGMGTVYRARQLTVDRDVAVKVLRAELARDEQAVLRFEREARLAISLDHPNLVRVFLSGRLSDGRLYFVMELLEGRSLAEELEGQRLPSLDRALIILMKLCAGLGAVHAAGIVHRDIKPENIYLVRRGSDHDFVKVVDFGLARALEPDGFGPTTTQTGRVFGTATYISPEAASGAEADTRSDIYSLGVLTFQLLTGELPFQGKTAAAVLMQHVHQEPPLLQTKGRGAEVPDDMARVVMRALSKDPDARQQTLAEFLDSLAQAAGDAGLLNDARALLLGTVWGDELAAPGSYLSELLGTSAPPSLPPAVSADTQVVVAMRDPEEEAFLSSAPRPFGSTSHELDVVPPRKKRQPRWLWAMLGLLVLVSLGTVAGSIGKRWEPAWAVEPQPPVGPPPVVAEGEPQIADVGTHAPMVEAPVFEGPLPGEPLAVQQLSETSGQSNASPSPRRKRRPLPKKPKRPVRVSPPAPGEAPAAVAETPTGKAPVLESDEGIDWTVPGFPEESAPATEPTTPVELAPATEPTTPVESAPATEPTTPVELAPTGTPDARARNPIVIDEPPQP